MNIEQYRVDVPAGESGDWRVDRFEITEQEEAFQRLRCAINSQRPTRVAPAGVYTRLSRNGTVVMTDTPDELTDHRLAIYKANGHCLVGGLGLGMVASLMLAKDEVEKVTIIELSEDVIKLVGSHLETHHGSRLELIQADVLAWKPPKGAFYDVVWMDIWDNICEDNLAEMGTLNRRYARKSGWKGCWQQEGCIGQRERVNSGRGWY